MIAPTLYVESDAPPAAEITPAQLAKRQRLAIRLCMGGFNPASWTLADRQARRWLGPQCGCKSLGVEQPEA